jgi:hypothetical protein
MALSRATAKSNIKVLAFKDDRKDKNKNSKKRKISESLITTTLNIVYKEVLSG